MAVHPALQSSESAEWYTPATYIEAARQVLGSIELDPASCELANLTVKASRYYDVYAHGLHQSWHAATIWLNPPYGREKDNQSSQEVWTCKLIAEYETGHVAQAILLVNASTSTGWFQRLWNYPICFTDHKIRFYNERVAASQPTHGNAFVYFGKMQTRFIEVFTRFGVVITPNGVHRAATTSSLWDLESEAS